MAINKASIRKILLDAWHPYVWIAVLAMALYGQTLGFGLTGHDDGLLVASQQGRLGDIANVPLSFARDVYWRQGGQLYRPALTLSLMADTIIGGGKNIWYHFSNLLLHIAAAGLLFSILRRTSPRAGTAFCLALLFTAHPILSQAVVWIPGRNDTLMAVFLFGSMRALLEYAGSFRWRWLAIHILLFAAALFTKETAVVAPVVWALSVLMLMRQRLSYRGIVALVSGWLAAVAGYGLARTGAVTTSPTSMNTPWENAVGLIGYLGKIIFPVKLSVLPLPQDIQLGYGIVAIGLLVLLFAWRGIVRLRPFIVGLAWFVIFLVPTAFRVVNFPNLLEHRVYVPLLGLLMMAAEAGALHKNQRLAGIAFAVALAAFSGLTFFHSRVFRDPIAYWENAVETSPGSASARRYLGEKYLEAGRPGEALKLYRQGLAIEPHNAGLLSELGYIYYMNGRMAEALEYIREAVRLEPNNARIRINLAMALNETKNPNEALQHLRIAVTLAPSEPKALVAMSYTQFIVQQYDSAAWYYKRALDCGLKPNPDIEHKLQEALRQNQR